VAEAEQLLELIDDDEQLVVGVDMRETDGFRETARTAAQRRVEQDLLRGSEFRIRTAQHVGRAQDRREVPKRIFARPHRRDAPARARARHEAAQHRRNQPGADQRRLAAARGPDEGEEAGRAEAAEKLVDLALASEEEVVFVGLERPKAGKRI
jgi:hypothetical protein